jgi:hypothetical protein
VAIMRKKLSTSNETTKNGKKATGLSSAAFEEALREYVIEALERSEPEAKEAVPALIALTTDEKMARVCWVEVERPENGHGVSFLYVSIRGKVEREVCVAFLDGFGWRDGEPSTVRILANRPPSIPPAHWSDIVKSAKAIVLYFVSNRGGLSGVFGSL